MAKNNTVAQLKASDGFSGAVGIAVLKTVSESQESPVLHDRPGVPRADFEHRRGCASRPI